MGAVIGAFVQIAVKHQVGNSEHVVVGQAGRVDRRGVDVVAQFPVVPVSGGHHKEHF